MDISEAEKNCFGNSQTLAKNTYNEKEKQTLATGTGGKARVGWDSWFGGRGRAPTGREGRSFAGRQPPVRRFFVRGRIQRKSSATTGRRPAYWGEGGRSCSSCQGIREAYDSGGVRDRF